MEGDCKYESVFLEVLTAPVLAGFLDALPEELHLEYYNCRAKNIIGNYINAVSCTMEKSSASVESFKCIYKSNLLSAFKNTGIQPSSAFGLGGQQTSSFCLTFKWCFVWTDCQWLSSASGHHVTSASAAVTSTTASEKLFTPKSELSAEEWQQFEAKEFTIGKIPLKPPPLELLNVYDLLSLFRSNMF
ncbi:nucleoporin-like protein 2 [Manacus vitellinus]|uniref:nucleoporin-like protein 2 n=1 Tax=Manacus vitellinus TaxID=328815 RepID=UPI000846CB2E|nr:nucleoporin-like protein 2 [Manacus vitellinus]XP_051642034.1 nucleoporin NUP42-like [Manacus candei]